MARRTRKPSRKGILGRFQPLSRFRLLGDTLSDTLQDTVNRNYGRVASEVLLQLRDSKYTTFDGAYRRNKQDVADAEQYANDQAAIRQRVHDYSKNVRKGVTDFHAWNADLDELQTFVYEKRLDSREAKRGEEQQRDTLQQESNERFLASSSRRVELIKSASLRLSGGNTDAPIDVEAEELYPKSERTARNRKSSRGFGD